MGRSRRRVLTAVIAMSALVGAWLGAASAAAAAPAVRVAAALPDTTSTPAIPPKAPAPKIGGGKQTPLERSTGLRVSIERIQPAAIVRGEPLRLSGSVSNVGDIRWRDAQVYLDIEATPVTTRTGLANIAGSDESFGRRIVYFGSFAEIGAVPPGTSVPYRLKIPYSKLRLRGTEGVYRVGVSVLSQNREGRDLDADARADTLLPMSPEEGSGASPTDVVTLIPFTFPVLRQLSGNFVNEDLATALTPGGQLRQLLTFVGRAPPESLQLVVDPALLNALEAMAGGYTVSTIPQENSDGDDGRNGTGQTAARQWLRDFDEITARQGLRLTAWGVPDSNSLAQATMPAVVGAAVKASEDYAADARLSSRLVNWQVGGAATRRGLVVARSAGADIHVVSDDSLVNLAPEPGAQYPPSSVRVPTSTGPLPATVYNTTIAGVPFTANLSALDFRQALMAEATVRSLTGHRSDSAWAIAAPLRWNPGAAASDVSLSEVYGFAAVRPVQLETATQSGRTRYVGPIAVSDTQPLMPALLVEAIGDFMGSGRRLTELLTDEGAGMTQYRRQLAVAGSSQWTSRPRLRLALIRRANRLAMTSLREVSVTGPSFLALSSESGHFPLTVTNGLDAAVTVQVNIQPANPALRVESVEPLQLEAGEAVDIQVATSSDSSGVTHVRVRLATSQEHSFGRPYEFDVRATQIGIAIWVVMGVGLAVVLVAAAVQIIRRIRTTGLTPREKPSP
ncbi:MAG: hypothetical protein AVDCRST_MAG21-1532 [uncultured Nocardioidaceae bacterium]|uniref:Secreted protein n=1 Tax=uncultured Nocardioidaceae bacterium TaxID=253824 RepID=A0A6J4N890_9ACTN|nr:MAG: hypothetical protein AVDCRST_MAG21-1532 [uncultured Nocardioidaceae bacterium]